MTDDDDALRGIDLDAWSPPPPPPADALAGAVLARMREPAREPAGRAPRRRWPIAAAALVLALAAAGVLVIARWGTAREPARGNGEVFATRASHLELGPSSAELDPGAEVRWQRDRRRIAAAQPRGAVLWRVAEEDTLVIDAGAAVASVEASGASLRVEVQMNLSDARAAGAGAVAAAAVALITVTVYDGDVKVTSEGQTVRAEPGAAVEIRPQHGDRDALTVGAAPPSLDQMRQEVRTLRQRLDAAEQALAAVRTQPTPRPPPPPPPDTLDRRAIERGLLEVAPAVEACDDGSYRGAITARLTVAPDGGVTDVRLQPAGNAAAACLELALRAARFDATARGAVIDRVFRFDAAPPARCDAAALEREARAHEAAGRHAAALAKYERLISCDPTPELRLSATLAACAARNAPAAMTHYERLQRAAKAQAVTACARHGIAEQDLACNHDALSDQGRDAYAAGQLARALDLFEKAYSCKPDPQYATKAFLAACNLGSVAKAGKQWRRMTPATRQQAMGVCVRNGITDDMLNQAAGAGSPP